MKTILMLMLSVIFSIPSSFGQEKTVVKNQDVELGKVSWHRNYNEAIDISKNINKPVLILFQEVPGCSTCRNYGQNVLSNPLMVEAIENLFVPLVIHNNKGGKDKLILEKFNEPSWNNPVVRIINWEGKDLVDRVNRDYSALGLYEAMKKALAENGIEIPEYFKILGQELMVKSDDKIEQAYFKMYCFWTGERHLGSAKGVLTTEAGFMGGHEVVKVNFDPELITEKELTDYAEEGKCSSIPESVNYKVATKDLKYSLQQTNYRFIPLSPIQQTKINSALAGSQDPMIYLSPKQIEWLEEINISNVKFEDMLYKDFEESWMNMINS